jgi:t-SNARE complex subunit (syntaxin)
MKPTKINRETLKTVAAWIAFAVVFVILCVVVFVVGSGMKQP